MIKIKDLQEAQLMDKVFPSLFTTHICEYEAGILNIRLDYYESLMERIANYNEKVRVCECHRSKDSYSFKKTYETDEFMSEGGFEKVYMDELSNIMKNDELKQLELENKRLQNDTLKYQQTIRERDETIKQLQTKDLRLSIVQKYWWAVALVVGIAVRVIDKL